MEYKVNEIFTSFQGEGLNTGKIATFIRLSGCNLKCSWCDTKGHESGQKMSAGEIVAEVMRVARPDTLVVITGGEPLMHDISSLVLALFDGNYRVAIETNGSIDFDWLEMAQTVFVAVAPKNQNVSKLMLARANEIKIVVDSNLENVKRLIEISLAYNSAAPVWLQPEGNSQESTQMIYLLLTKTGLAEHFDVGRLRFGHQMHKIRGWE